MYTHIHKSINKTKPRNLGYVKAVTTRHHWVSQKNKIGHKMQETLANFNNYPNYQMIFSLYLSIKSSGPHNLEKSSYFLHVNSKQSAKVGKKWFV